MAVKLCNASKEEQLNYLRLVLNNLIPGKYYNDKGKLVKAKD